MRTAIQPPVLQPSRRRGTVVATYLMVFIAMVDVNIVVVGLPSIQAGLAISTGTVQWIINAYTLCLSTLALSAGALGDRFGRKRVLLLGVVLFTIGSLGCALAPTGGALLAGRFIQGVGAAFGLPGALSMLAQAFPEPITRARAIAGYMTVAGAAALVAPTLGGLLIATAGWPWLFAINLPIGVAALVVGAVSLPESADPDHVAVDGAGQLGAIITLGALCYGLIAAGSTGWTGPRTLISLALSVVAGVLFVIIELRQPLPMLPVRLFADPRFALPNLAGLTIGFTAFTLVTLFPTYLQLGQGHSALITGAMLLPSAVAGLVMPTVAGRWVTRTGPYPSMAAGLGAIGLAALMLLTEQPNTPYPLTAAAVGILGAGVALSLTPVTAAALAAVPRQRSGVAAATTNAVRQTGTTLGVAVLGSLLAAQLHHPGRTTQASYTTGLHLITAVAAGVAIGCCAVVLVGARQIRHLERSLDQDSHVTAARE